VSFSDAVLGLERRMARRRELSAILVTLDGEDRWGYPDEARRAEMDREGGDARTEHYRLADELTAEVAALRARAPEEIAAWAQTHVELLDAYIASVAADSTEAFVAKGERGEWLEVAAGTKAWVDENVNYVHLDRDRYRTAFGFDPS
jgi:hypothetical protein